MDYLLHFALEAVGSLIAIAAYRHHRCDRPSHRLLIWTLLSALTTVVTVQVVG